MQKRIVSLVAPLVVGIMALALGWFAHAAAPLAAQGIAGDRGISLADPFAPAAPPTSSARLTYQGRLTSSSGEPVNSPVAVTFQIYTGTPAYTPTVPVWQSAVRTITPTNGLFTVYLGDGADPDLTPFVLIHAATIGVTVSGDAEMTPRQPLNTAMGHSDSQAGVVGTSGSYIGVLGYSFAGDGVSGLTNDLTKPGVAAGGAGPSGIALELSNGGIKVSGAGIGTGTPVFTVQVLTSTINNNVTPSSCAGNCVVIDNPLTNGRPSAIVIVTPNFSPAGVASGIYTDHPISVWYDMVGGRNKWEILHPDGSLMLNGAAYNVLVVNP